jgi:hypothetical protein
MPLKAERSSDAETESGKGTCACVFTQGGHRFQLLTATYRVPQCVHAVTCDSGRTQPQHELLWQSLPALGGVHC